MNLTDYYYENKFGVYPFETDEQQIKTDKTIAYLFDIGYSEKEIISIIDECQPDHCLSYNNLPDSLWNNSLLKKDVFYYHNLLQVRSRPAMLNMKTLEFNSNPFFIEMKISFTINDLLNYFYTTTNQELSFRDEKKDIGALNFLLKSYNRIDFIEPVDFILFLIDYACKEKDCSTSSILQIDSEFKADVFELLKVKTIQAAAQNFNKIIFR